jgi:ATP-dependent helicase/nuclease subunit A
MSKRPVADLAQRERALEPERSFIVQAPAGSGKTELLIQRYLALLGRVERPEEIEAITFTRKASAEMRKRVWQALVDARANPRPQEPHRAKTWDLARAAVGQDERKGWMLAENARRLRIETIDALCLGLTRQMPVLARLGAQPDPIDDASHLFAEAARATLEMVEESDAIANDVASVLEHLDNDTERAHGLIVEMLMRRDQWLNYLGETDDRAALEAGFAAIWHQGIERARGALPDGTTLGLPASNEVEDWLAAVDQYLTKDGEWRKKLKFPDVITGNAGLLAALSAMRELPRPTYDDAQWEILGAIMRLARIAAAQLRVVFAAHNQADFIEIVHGALLALGSDEEPTDLLIALDYRIRHLLVDEFQDTSISQFTLLEKLTREWQPGDGRTLFVVGDPMQSIYRFRQAEVGLFLRARQDGVGSVLLESLTLQANFRSQAGIVDWVNETFAPVMPRVEAIAEGAVPYSASVAVHEPQPGAVHVHAFFNGDKAGEARRVAQLARAALDAPGHDPARPSTCAILVRSRPHLAAVLPALRAAGIPYRAVEIDRLDQRPVVRDLIAITRALSHLADRPAWLALLRAPWCGLKLSDLHALAGGEGAHGTIFELLGDDARLATLSNDGRQRVAAVRDVMSASLAERMRGTLRDAVEGAWLALGGPACVEDVTDLEDAELFLDHLESQEIAGAIADLEHFEANLERFRAQPDLGADDRLQVMTIHRAKGLEFDTIILPHLGASQKSDTKSLLAWVERKDEPLLLAALNPAGGDKDSGYEYIRRLHKVKSGNEDARLLYVAATRPRRTLHLLGDVKVDGHDVPPARKPPAANSLLEKLWGAVSATFDSTDFVAAPQAVEGASNARDLLRRFADGIPDVAMPESAAWFPMAAMREAGATLEFSWVNETLRHVGTVAHRWLQRISDEGLEHWHAQRVRELIPLFARELAARGVDEAGCDSAALRVAEALTRTLEDARGRWVLGAHAEAASELRLTLLTSEGTQRFVIDRTFTAEGRRWIVDYKTSDHQGANLEAFLDEQLKRYRPQLEAYATALGDAAALRGLYFPLVGGWREWG